MSGSAAIWFGLAIVTLGLTILGLNLRFVRRSQLAMATVVGYREMRSSSSDDNASVHYRPQFEFRTASGRLVRAEPNTAEGEPAWPVGEAVPIRYLPDQPDKVRPDGARHLLAFPLIALCLGSFFVALGLAQ
jgi:hypothetical protein